MTSAPTSRRPGFTALRDRRFVALFAAHAVSNLGDWLAFMALYQRVALEWRAGPATLGVLGAAYLAPLALVAPMAGVVVDRSPLRRVLIATDLGRAALVLGLAATHNLATMCVLLFGLQALGCFFNPAQSAAVARLVPAANLLGANALTTQAAHLSKILGPAIAGLLVGAFGAGSCFVADAASFAASGLVLWTLPALPPLGPKTAGRTSLAAELRTGVQLLLQTPELRRTVAAALAGVGAMGVWLAVFGPLARDRWHADARWTGFLVSCLGAGAVCGAATAVGLARQHRPMVLLHAALFGLAVALAAAAFAGSRLGAIATSAAIGMALGVILVCATTLLQTHTPAAALGRVSSVAIAAVGLAETVCALVAGGAARFAAASSVLLVAAGVLMMLALALGLALRAARPADPAGG